MSAGAGRGRAATPTPRLPAASAALLGRERECRLLAGLAGASAEGAGGLVLVSGEAGVGKTALVEAVLAGAPLASVRGAASPVGTPPLGPLAQAVDALRRGFPQVFAAVPGRPALARLLGEPTEAADADRAAFFRTLTAALCAIAGRQPYALVLDDMQWADRATLDLCAELAQQARRAALLVVLVHRSDGVLRGHPVRTLRETLRRARILQEVALEPLEPPEALALAARLLPAEWPDDTRRSIAERSGGVPLFIEALAATPQRPLPETVRDAILDRIDALPAAGRQAADAAAVAGSQFPLSLLVALNGGEQGIEDLLAGGLLVEREPGIAAFRTTLARDAIHAAIPWTRRRGLHRRAAETLSASGSGLEQAAAHWQAAGQAERSRSAWLQAAARSRRLHAHADAMLALQQALDLWPAEHDGAARLQALEQVGDSAQLARCFGDALRAWRELADRALDAGDRPAGARAWRRIAALHELVADWPQALDAREDAAAAFLQAGLPAEAAVDLLAAATRLRHGAQYAAATGLLARAAAAADAGGAADVAVRIAALAGNVTARAGRVEEGIAAVREALAQALAMNRPDLAGECYQRLADAIERSGRYTEAVQAYRDGLDLCERHALPAAASSCRMCMGYALLRSGGWDDALAATARSLAEPLSDPIVQAGAHAITALVHALRGEPRRAEPSMAAAAAWLRQGGSAAVELIGRWALAAQASAAGDADAAAARCRSLLARWPQIDDGSVGTPVLRWVATRLADAGDRDGVRACADALGDIATRLGHGEPLSALAHVLGELALLDGDAPRAAEQFERAAGLVEPKDFPLERGTSRWRGAVAVAACGRVDDAVAMLREAARCAGRLAARPLAEAVTRELRRLGQPVGGALGPRAGGRAERAGLTARQLQVLAEVARGLTDKEVARALSLSPRTVEMHVARALAALDCRSRTEAVRRLVELGMVGGRG